MSMSRDWGPIAHRKKFHLTSLKIWALVQTHWTLKHDIVQDAQLEKGNRQDLQTERCRQRAVGRKTLKGLKLESVEVDNFVFINDSLCSYYKRLRYMTLWSTNKYMHNFWMSNGSIRIKVRENPKPNTVSLVTGLEEIFPENELEESEPNQ